MTISAEQRETVLAALEEGKSLRDAAAVAELGSEAAIRRLVAKDEAFATQYARARDIGLDKMADEALAITDDATPGDVNVARLRFDARRWYLSKLAPKRYSDKLDLSGSIKASVTLRTTPEDEAL